MNYSQAIEPMTSIISETPKLKRFNYVYDMHGTRTTGIINAYDYISAKMVLRHMIQQDAEDYAEYYSNYGAYFSIDRFMKRSQLTEIIEGRSNSKKWSFVKSATFIFTVSLIGWLIIFLFILNKLIK